MNFREHSELLFYRGNISIVPEDQMMLQYETDLISHRCTTRDGWINTICLSKKDKTLFKYTETTSDLQNVGVFMNSSPVMPYAIA